MNTALLRQIQEHIAARPGRFSAAHWGWARNAGKVVQQGAEPRDFRCCIAGHALVLSGTYSEYDLVCQSGIVNEDGYLWQRAAEVLQLSKRQSNQLFFPSQWSSPFKEQYYLGGRDEESSVCAAYINHFLEQQSGAAESVPSEREAEATHRLESPLCHV